MARRKTDNKSDTTGRGAGRRSYNRGSFLGGLFRFFTLGPVWQLILLAAIIGVICWQWGNITSWFTSNVFRLFGWGLIFLIIAVVTLVVVVLRRNLYLLVKYWNRWLGGIVLLLVVWGILSFIPGRDALAGVSLGGKFGIGIIGHTDLVGVFRVLGLFILGIIVVMPGTNLKLARSFATWLVEKFKRPGYKPMREKDLLHPSETRAAPSRPVVTADTVTLRRAEPRRPFAADMMEKDLKEEVVSEAEPELVPASTAAPTPQDLKQVAQDVWKKYGESPDLVVVDGWKLPPLEILDMSPEIQFSQADNQERARLIEEALDSYGVEAKVVQINEGPTITQFGVEPGWDRKTREVREKDKDGNVTVRLEEVSKTRVKVDRISSLQNDLALALAAPSIRIEAPVPGKSIVGIEVPNTISSLVSLRGVIETSTFQKLHAKSKLSLALGKGAGGEAIAGDLAKMPHILIAGATGSGKTVCLNAVICCLLLNNTPDDIRFIMIDPKRVELTAFNSIPHLATSVIVDAEKALEALRWLSREMNARYQTLASSGSRNIEGYNKNKQGDERMVYLVLIIDELADLIMLGGDEVEQILCHLAQMSRAVGIHLVVATQRPSVDVVTGLIKANFPTRISFAVTSQVDSRTILDIGGAEKLLGSGDMLYMPTEAAKPKRLQGCYVSDTEAERLVYFWGNQKKGELSPLLKAEDLVVSSPEARRGSYPEDTLMEAARQLAREHDRISTSFLQRRLHIGYPRAARIMEQLEMEMDEQDEEEEQDF
jgi:S-DNA-T family DNA segregation ATPase FtsK/SpoIIIE